MSVMQHHPVRHAGKIVTEKVTGDLMLRNHHQYLLMFLKHIAAVSRSRTASALDNYCTHKKVRDPQAVGCEPADHVFSSMTPASWMNLVEMRCGITKH